MATAVIAAVQGHLQTGKAKALAVTSIKRSASLPNVPTVAEAGLAGFDVSAWNGLLAPAGTPDAIVNEIWQTSNRVMQAKEVNDQLIKLGLDLALMNPAEFSAFLQREVQEWGKVVRETGVKAE